MDKPEESIPSPFIQPIPEMTQAKLHEVCKLLGVRSVFLAVSNDQPHKCSPGNCSGHSFATAYAGFSDEQVAGLAAGILQRGGYQIIAPDESEEV